MFYSHGINHYEINKNHDTIHAEVDCIMNLKINKKNKMKTVNLFVFRSNPKGRDQYKPKEGQARGIGDVTQ